MVSIIPAWHQHVSISMCGSTAVPKYSLAEVLAWLWTLVFMCCIKRQMTQEVTYNMVQFYAHKVYL